MCVLPIGLDLIKVQNSADDRITSKVPAVQTGVLAHNHVFDSDVREDRAMMAVLDRLRPLEETEVMMVIVQLKYVWYLQQLAKGKGATSLPLPHQLDKDKRRGDFDILIIHKRYGLILFEVKALGSAEMGGASASPETLRRRLKRAVKQLNKHDDVLKHVLPDEIRTTKIVALPFVESGDLKALCGDKNEQQELCVRLGADDTRTDKALPGCVCKDDLEKKPNEWWQQTVCRQSDPEALDPAMSNELYGTLCARFCGPATSICIPCLTPAYVEMRTLAQAVAYTGLRMAILTLHPYQVELLHRPEKKVHLSGPPGTGKTVVLVLKALQWLQEGNDVHIVSSSEKSRAVSFLIQAQLEYHLQKQQKQREDSPQKQQPQQGSPQKQQQQQESPQKQQEQPSTGNVFLHQYSFGDSPDDKNAQKAAEELFNWVQNGDASNGTDQGTANASSTKPVFVIADEALGQGFKSFCKRLVKLVPDVHLWAACVESDIWEGMDHVAKLTTPLRSPPSVIEEIEQSSFVNGTFVQHYQRREGVPDVTKGPPPIWLRHEGAGHNTADNHPINCEGCAGAIAQLLLGKLRIGKSESGGLEFRDVLVLSKMIPDDSAFMKSLQNTHSIPVTVFNRNSSSDEAEKVAVAKDDKVVLAEQDLV